MNMKDKLKEFLLKWHTLIFAILFIVIMYLSGSTPNNLINIEDNHAESANRDMSRLRLAINAYYRDHNSMPGDLNDLFDNYISKIPVPHWGAKYNYMEYMDTYIISIKLPSGFNYQRIYSKSKSPYLKTQNNNTFP